jgi:hypothetical protein
MKSIIDGDLQKLVHLSNGSHMVECAGPLQVGGVCRAETLIASVTNTVADKAVRVKGHVYCGNTKSFRISSTAAASQTTRTHSRTSRSLAILSNFQTMLLWMYYNQKSGLNSD